MNARAYQRPCSLLMIAGLSASLGWAWEATYTISDNVNLVVLDVSVKNPKGGFVTGLRRDQFRVYDNGRSRPITEFSSADAPVSVGLVLDDSGSMRYKRPEIVMAGLAFAKESNRNDEFFVVNFNDSIYYGLPKRVDFTDQIQLLRRALYFGQPDGQTALYDAIASALKHLELSGRELRTLIVVSDGGDNVSKIRLAELMALIEASRATIFTVGLLDPNDRDLNPKVLRKLSLVSGGEFFEPASLNDVLPIFEKISKDIRHRYTIGFTPGQEGDKRKLRSVKVSAQQGGRKLMVHARTSYSILPANQIVPNSSAEHVSEK